VVVSSGTFSGSTIYFGQHNKASLEVSGGVFSSASLYAAPNANTRADIAITGGTFNPGSLSLGSSGTAAMTVSGGTVETTTVYVGSGKDGRGDLTMTGGTWNTSANLHVGSSGSATMTLDGGVLTANGMTIGTGTTGNGTVTVSSGTVAVTTGTLTVGDGGIGALDVSGGLVKAKVVSLSGSATGNGTLTLSGSTGSRAVLEATQIKKNNSSGTASLVLDGGIIRAQAASTTFISGFGAEDVVLGNGGAYLDSNGFNISVTSSLSGSGGLTKQGMGVLTVSASNSYSGGTVIEGGSMIVSADYALGTGNVTINSGTLTVQATNSGTNISIASSVSGSGSLRKLGAGSLTLSASNSYSGGTVIDAGQVFVTADHAFGTGDVAINSGTLVVQAGVGSDIGIASSVSGNGRLTKEGAGSLTLSASNSYKGGTVIEAGTVLASANSALGTGAVTIKSGTLSVQAGVDFGNAVTLEGGSFGRGVLSGASLANTINLTGSMGGVTTKARVAGGSSSGDAMLEGSFSASSSAINDEIRVGNVFHLSGVSLLDGDTGETDVFVLEITVADITADNILGWLNSETNQWVNAVDGNIGGTATNLGNKAYDAGSDFILGYYGVDISKGTVWAVINHNSEFAVIPEPGTWALLVLGGGALLGWKRRRSGSQVL
jgi:autotransporter-associated beta strand protein